MTADAYPTSLPAPRRRERRVAETRRAIRVAARELFDEQGYPETTIEQIAERADIAERTFYRYFPTKEALLFADFDDLREKLGEMLDGRPADEPPLRSLLLALVDYAGVIQAEHPKLEWCINLMQSSPSSGVYEKAMLMEQNNEMVMRFLAQRLGVDPETDPRPHAWATTVLAVFGSAIKRSMTDDDRSPGESFLALAREMIGGLSDALAPRPTVRS